MTQLNEIRSSFLDFFEKNNHRVIPSSPLIPQNDPTWDEWGVPIERGADD